MQKENRYIIAFLFYCGKIIFAAIVITFFAKCSVPKSKLTNPEYTIQSTYEKLVKKYPNITRVTKTHSIGLRQFFNVPYVTINHSRKLYADIFYPVGYDTRLLPCILMIHGGGWISGSKDNLTPMAQALAQKGFTTIIPEYRLSKEAKYPAGLNDVLSALDFLVLNAADYQIDTSKIIIYGCSAGAQLATLVGVITSNQISDEARFISNRAYIKAIVNIDGIVSFVHPTAEQEWNGHSANAWLGNYNVNYNNWVEASPLTHMHNQVPPTLFVNSSYPRFHAGRENYLEVLNENKIANKVIEFENCPHSFWMFQPWFDVTKDEVLGFLDVVLKKENF